MNLHIRVLSVAVALLSIGTGSLRAADAIPCEKRLPREAVAYVSFRNVDETKAQWALTQQGRLFQDEALADTRKALKEQFVELSKKIEEELGLSLSDLLEIPHGEVAASLTVSAAGKPLPTLMIDFGTNEEGARRLLEKGDARAKDAGWERATSEFDDTKLVLHTRKTEGDAASGPGSFAYFLKDSFLVAGSDLDALKAVIRRWDGKHESTLAENPVFKYIAERCRDKAQEIAPLVTWFVDPLTLVRAALAVQEDAPPQLAMAMAMLPVLGIDQFKGLGGTFDLARGDFDLVSRTLIYIDQPPKGLLNIFQFQENPQTPPKWVTADTTSYSSIQWDIAKAFAAIESIVDMLQGPGATARMIEQLAAEEQFGKLHLKKDLIDLLTGKIQVVGTRTGSGDDAEESQLYALELRNPTGMKGTLRKLARIPGVPLEEREFQGESIYEFSGGGLGLEGDAAIGVAQNQLIIATEVKQLERMLRGAAAGETLADSPAYKRIARRFPEKTATIGFDREDGSLESLIATLKRMSDAGVIGGDQADLIAKLPSAELLRKYLSSSGSFMQSDEHGFRIMSFTLKKEAE